MLGSGSKRSGGDPERHSGIQTLIAVVLVTDDCLGVGGEETPPLPASPLNTHTHTPALTAGTPQSLTQIHRDPEEV